MTHHLSRSLVLWLSVMLAMCIVGCASSTPTLVVLTLAPALVPTTAPTMQPDDVIATKVAITQTAIGIDAAVAATLTAAAPVPTLIPTPLSTLTLIPTSPPRPTSVPLLPTPELAEPAQGGVYQSPITFQWRGSPGTGQSYQVIAYHLVSGYVHQSGPLTSLAWTTDLPAEKFGEWRWKVCVIRSGTTVATSAEGMFWFDPFPNKPTPPGPTVPPAPTTEGYPP